MQEHAQIKIWDCLNFFETLPLHKISAPVWAWALLIRMSFLSFVIVIELEEDRG
jgi:hypothetical protein